MFRRNVEFEKVRRSSTWRKVAIGTWDAPGDPTVYSKIDIDATQALRAIARLKLEGHPANPLALLVRAVAEAMARQPELNVMLRMGKIHQRSHVNVMVPALVGHSGEEITGILLRDADQLSTAQIADALAARARALWAGQDPEFERTKQSLAPIPAALMNPLFKALGFIFHSLNLWIPGLGIDPDSLGSVQVTSIGELGIDEGYGPLDPYARLPFMVVAGSIQPRPVAIDGRVEIRPIWPICFSADHRLGDGFLFGRFCRRLRSLLTSYDFLIGALPAQERAA